MGRATIVLTNDATRRRALEWVKKAPYGTRIDFKAHKRTIPQNSRLWAMLSDIARQVPHHGRKYTPDIWKCIFMDAALGKRTQYVPTLDGESVVPLGYHSSDLSIEEMSDLQAFISAWCAENDIELDYPEDIDAARG